MRNINLILNMSCFEVLLVVTFFNLVKGFHQVCFCIPGINISVDKNMHRHYNPILIYFGSESCQVVCKPCKKNNDCVLESCNP